MCSTLSNVEGTLSIVSTLPRDCMQLQWPAFYWRIRMYGCVPGLIVNWRCLIIPFTFVFTRGLGLCQWVPWLGCCLYTSFASLISSLEKSYFQPQMLNQAILVYLFHQPVVEPKSGHLGARRKNKKRWWRFSSF